MKGYFLWIMIGIFQSMRKKHTCTTKRSPIQLILVLKAHMIIASYAGQDSASILAIFKKGIMNRSVRVGYAPTATTNQHHCLAGRLMIPRHKLILHSPAILRRLIIYIFSSLHAKEPSDFLLHSKNVLVALGSFDPRAPFISTSSKYESHFRVWICSLHD